MKAGAPLKATLSDFDIMLMWSFRWDTWVIAERLGVPESVVANRLAKIRDRNHG